MANTTQAGIGGGRPMVLLPEGAAACARDLYARLREADARGGCACLVASLPVGPEWVAVHDRLRRTAVGLGGIKSVGVVNAPACRYNRVRHNAIKSMESKTARLTILIDPNKKKAFERLCAEQDLTPSQVVRQMIREYLAQHGVQYVPSANPAKPEEK